MIEEKKKVTNIHRPHSHQKTQTDAWKEAAVQKQRRGLKKRMTALTVVTAFVVILMGITLFSQWQTIAANNEEQQQMEEQMVSLEEKEADLKQQVKDYNDLDYIAEVAREEYYLTKEGETLYKLPESDSSN
ncbi:hypothetical protein CHL76_13910 [Marinococcus halophilus]|uniref:Cell division protein DIVIC n=1 Tax=Marinococcus halophilus TaxID=1371 RepID=A0A510Y8T4_MARHA|nr:septum formation initiator family protein [Marinococcus halophilus]OZT79234.1 hypothetical protein CHL76_13910 [Marinococcus halophilus]GEK59798.1 hypothetical protein MHA01_27030 [Marinococcus halophilus]